MVYFDSYFAENYLGNGYLVAGCIADSDSGGGIADNSFVEIDALVNWYKAVGIHSLLLLLHMQVGTCQLNWNYPSYHRGNHTDYHKLDRDIPVGDPIFGYIVV